MWGGEPSCVALRPLAARGRRMVMVSGLWRSGRKHAAGFARSHSHVVARCSAPFCQPTQIIVLDRAAADESTLRIQQRYRVPFLESADLADDAARSGEGEASASATAVGGGGAWAAEGGGGALGADEGEEEGEDEEEEGEEPRVPTPRQAPEPAPVVAAAPAAGEGAARKRRRKSEGGGRPQQAGKQVQQPPPPPPRLEERMD